MTFCGMQNKLIKNVSERINANLVDYTTLSQPTPFNAEQTAVIGNGGKYNLSEGTGSYNFPDGLPVSIMWLAFSSGTTPHRMLRNTDTQVNACKIITEFDAPEYEYEIVDPVQVQGVGATSWNDDNASLYYNDLYFSGTDNQLKYRVDSETLIQVNPMGGPVAPYFFTELNGDFVLLQLNTDTTQWYNRGNGTASPWATAGYTGGGSLIPYVYSAATKSYGTTLNVVSMSDTFGGANILPYEWYYSQSDWGVEMIKWGVSDDGHPMIIHFGEAPQDGSGFHRGFCTHNYFNTRDEIYNFIAGGGIKFKTDKVYKPIIHDGWVTGYSDDMSTPSELDDWHGSTVHSVSPEPPGPPPPPPPPGDDDDNDDPVNTAGAPFAAGLCHYYALTAGSALLAHISEALGTWDIENTHKDLYKNLVSCKLIKPPAAIPTTGSEPFTIYGVKPQYQGADITLPVVSGNPDASFGPYTIDRKFNDFRDYAPYTRVSIYLPYCGWCDLPSHVVGRQVSVHYYTDIIAATCKAVVFCNNNIIAEAAGVIGLDIPFVADNVGAKMQAVTAGMIAALGGGIQLGAGIGTMVSTKSGSGAKAALSGASQYLSGYSQMAMAFNENTTEISGKNGDGCCLSGATNIIIKIVRPKKGSYTSAPYTPPGYGHNVGFVSQKQVKVSSVSGLLIADNVDTSGISGATEAERAEIKRVLETGLIVNAAPE